MLNRFFMKRSLIVIFLLLLSSVAFPQAAVDTLRGNLSKCQTEKCQFDTKLLLAAELIFIDINEVDKLINELKELAKKNESDRNLEVALVEAYLELKKENSGKGFEIFSSIISEASKTANYELIAKAQLGLSKCYTDQNDLKKAVEYAFEALRGFEKNLDRNSESMAYSQIASINYKLKNYNKAIDYFKKSLEISIKNHLSANTAYAYNNLGNLYASDKKSQDIAIEYYRRALGIRKQQKHEQEIAPILTNIGGIYYDKKDFKEAEYYFKQALESNIKVKRNKGAGICLINLGSICFEQNDFIQANKNYREALKYLDEDYQIKEMLYYNLGEVNLKLGNLEDALKYNDTCMTIKDSLYSREAIKSLNDMQVKYETEKTQLELDKKALESKNKGLIIYAAMGGIVLLLGLAFFIFRGLRQKQRDNLMLEEKNAIIVEKSKIVEAQHKDITDSIKYAERIQTAILPPEKLWKEILPHSFVYYRPKDVLSGDFYWIEETKTHVYVAAADCTGHGVPGALVSIINYNLLNKAVLEKNLTDPAEILNQVNEWLTQALHQTYNTTSMRDGMDVSLCVIEKKSKKMKFAGAFNSGYMIKDGVVEEMPADKKPVGAFIEDDITSFTSKEYQLSGKETIYLFSDGYADQFGGPKGKKFKYKNLQKMLLEGQDKNFDTQKDVAQETFLSWKGNYEQTDDVLLIGFRYS